MPKAIAPGLIEAVRTEYVTAVTRPRLQDLAAKYNIGYRTLARYSRLGEWTRQRDEHWRTVAQGLEKKNEEEAHRIAEAEMSEKERTLRMLRFIRDGLLRSFQEGITRIVITGNLDEKDVAKIIERWDKMATEDIAKFVTSIPRAIAETVRAIELVQGSRTTIEGRISLDTLETSPAELAGMVINALIAHRGALDGDQGVGDGEDDEPNG
jgi:hypothetical protein